MDTLEEAKTYCEEHSDCRGISRDNNGYEPRRGLDVNNNVIAHELWLCKGTCCFSLAYNKKFRILQI